MSTKKYHSLNYDHTEINLLLSKIEKYKVLTEEEYQHLFVTIGLSKIDQALETIKENKESYELLLKKHEYDKNYLTGCIDAINKALEDAKKDGIKGKDTTPYLLKHIKEHTEGRSLESNIQLVYNNALVGAKIAKEYAKLK